jgi:hypothetical protein
MLQRREPPQRSGLGTPARKCPPLIPLSPLSPLSPCPPCPRTRSLTGTPHASTEGTSATQWLGNPRTEVSSPCQESPPCPPCQESPPCPPCQESPPVKKVPLSSPLPLITHDRQRTATAN